MKNGRLLDVHDLHGGYGNVPVLRGISFSVGEGEIVGLLGHNGMGKTTLLKHLMGYLPVSGGVITFDGDDITRLPVHRRGLLGLGYVPQGREIFPQLSVTDNLRFAWHGHGDEAHALHRILRDFPRLEPLLERKGDNLSGGEKQLLAIARCLMADPVMVLLDEPTEGIQPSIIDEISALLLRIRAESGLSILLVEQNFDFLAGLADRLLVLERGEIRANVTGAEAKSPDFLAEFTGLGANPPPTGTAPAAPLPSFSNPPAPAPGRATAPAQEGPMTLKRPDLKQMQHIAGSLSMTISDPELADYLRVMEPYLQAYDQLNALPDNPTEVRYPRTGGG
ncbi:MAG: ATP-binding cassette domain-containing protein, partial [Gammaproteobacteria bacterium]|nr:ATP-binding cassette domain-containing protein [Gammaproteobacteria bacterium]